MASRNSMKSAFDMALDFLFPRQCVNCRKEGSLLCPYCKSLCLRFTTEACLEGHSGSSDVTESQRCERCSFSIPNVDDILIAFIMEGTISKVVHSLKYRDTRSIAPLLSDLLVEMPGVSRLAADRVIPMASHKQRERARGYNQAELLARGVAQRLGLPLDLKTLKKVKNTASQITMRSREERMLSVRDAFHASESAKGLRFILVDDVITTGATISAAAEQLKGAGALSVAVLGLAREL